MATKKSETTKYSWAWVMTVTRAPENIQTDLKDGQKATVAESNDWFNTEQEARADASLSKVCDLDMPDSWGLDLVIKKKTFYH